MIVKSPKNVIENECIHKSENYYFEYFKFSNIRQFNNHDACE